MPSPQPATRHEPILRSVNDDAVRVLVVDDSDLFRTGLRRLFEQAGGLTVVAEARSGEDAVLRAAELRPDVVVMDIGMPGIGGVEATRRLLEVSPHSTVLMLTGTDDHEMVLDAVLAGACGYLLKGDNMSEIVRGVRAAATGQSLITPTVASSLLATLRRHDAREQPALKPPDLTPRELDVLQLLVAGCETIEIGRRLHLSPSTVKHHVSSTLVKLGVGNRVQAAVLAVRQGLVSEEPAAPPR
jgi:DNA-binding NarL/FixJ family response regulator